MIKYRNILVVIDPTMPEQSALLRAVELARLEDIARIKVFLAIYDFSYEITSILSNEEREEMRQGVVTHRLGWLSGMIKPYKTEGLDIEAKVIWHSRPFECVLQEVKEHEHDLVITSAHHHSLLKSFIFTPSDWHLLRKCPCPVLVTKHHGWPAGGNILAAMNISDEAEQMALNERIIHEAKVIAQLVKASLHLVNAFPAPIVNIALELPGFSPELYSDAMQQHHQTEMEEYARKFDIPAECIHIVEGMPEDVLPELAKSLDAELTILGSVGRTGWSAAFIGNTAERVVDSIHGDLLVVKAYE